PNADLSYTMSLSHASSGANTQRNALEKNFIKN
ncbi:hypothetical protein HKBW3S42_02196, partial [Candidatus Hakubella thermalkaliphila]